MALYSIRVLSKNGINNLTACYPRALAALELTCMA